MKRITEEYAYYLYNNLKDKLVFYAHYGYYYKNSDQKHVWLLKNSKIENRHIGNCEKNINKCITFEQFLCAY